MLMPQGGTSEGIIPMNFHPARKPPPRQSSTTEVQSGNVSATCFSWAPGLFLPFVGFTFLLLSCSPLSFFSPFPIKSFFCNSHADLSVQSFSWHFFTWERNKRLYAQSLCSFLHGTWQLFPQNTLLSFPKSPFSLLHRGRQIHPSSQRSVGLI